MGEKGIVSDPGYGSSGVAGGHDVGQQAPIRSGASDQMSGNPLSDPQQQMQQQSQQLGGNEQMQRRDW